jgi:hypothetical protein
LAARSSIFSTRSGFKRQGPERRERRRPAGDTNGDRVADIEIRIIGAFSCGEVIVYGDVEIVCRWSLEPQALPNRP